MRYGVKFTSYRIKSVSNSLNQTVVAAGNSVRQALQDLLRNLPKVFQFFVSIYALKS